jgi:hypothetical protein
MEDAFTIQPLDWSLLEELTAAAHPFDRAAVQTALERAAFTAEPEESDLVALWDSVPEVSLFILLPTAIRVDRARYMTRTLDWLASLEGTALDSAITDLATGIDGMASTIESLVLLSYFSSTYRAIVVGLEAGYPGRPGRYDGPPALLRAVGGYLFPDRKAPVIYSPAETAMIATELTQIDVAQFPAGDISILNRFVGQRIDDAPLVEQTCPAHFARIREVYREASDHGRGMRVLP